MGKPTLSILADDFTIYRCQPNAPLPSVVFKSPYYWVGKTDQELSIVCDSAIDIAGGIKNAGWSCIKVIGPLDFSITGILAAISAVLAEAQISIFALSTYDTDYLLVKSHDLQEAINALVSAGYVVS